MLKNKNILEIKNLNKIFSNGKRKVHAVNDVSFDLKSGETVGLIGESGSGKTTIGRTLIRLNDPTSGQIILNGTNIGKKKLDKSNNKLLRKNIQMIFQDPYSSLNEQMNISSIISEPIKTLGLDKKLLNDFVKDYDEILKFFKYKLIKNAFELRRKNDLDNINFIKGEYQKLIKKLELFAISSNSKSEEIESLISQYYNVKIEGNSIVTNNNLSLIKNLLSLWKDIKSKYKNGEVDEENERLIIKTKLKIENVKRLLQHTKDYYIFKDNLDALEKYNNYAEKYVLEEKDNSTIKNLDISNILERESKESENNAKNSRSIREHNLFLIESKVKLLFSKMIKTNKKDVYFDDIFVEFKKLEKDKIDLIFSYIEDVNYEVKLKIDNNLIILIDKNKTIATIDFSKFFDSVLENNKISEDFFYLRFSENLPLIDYDFTNEQINFIEGIKNKSRKIILNKIKTFENKVENLFHKKPDSKYKIELANLKNKLSKLEKEHNNKFKKFIVDFEINEKNKYNKHKELILNEKNLVDSLQKEAQNIFESKKDLIIKSSIPFDIKSNLKKRKHLEERLFNLKREEKYLSSKNEKNSLNKRKSSFEKISKIENDLLKNNIHEEKLFMKMISSKIKKSEELNIKLENESKRISKDIKLIFDIVTGKGLVKSKLKKYLVREKVFDALEEAGLTKAHAFRYPHEFSGGMRQRVGIARAIISEPKIIIADEPIAALDLSIQAQIANLLKEMQKKRKMSMIFIAHDLAMVKHISDKILIIHLGRIVESGTTKEVFENPIHPYTKNLINSMPDISKISKDFENNNFEATYLDEYSIINQPKYHNIKGKHKVLATDMQIKEWWKK